MHDASFFCAKMQLCKRGTVKRSYYTYAEKKRKVYCCCRNDGMKKMIYPTIETFVFKSQQHLFGKFILQSCKNYTG